MSKYHQVRVNHFFQERKKERKVYLGSYVANRVFAIRLVQ